MNDLRFLLVNFVFHVLICSHFLLDVRLKSSISKILDLDCSDVIYIAKEV